MRLRENAVHKEVFEHPTSKQRAVMPGIDEDGNMRPHQ
jgi:hypothetical protein